MRKTTKTARKKTPAKKTASTTKKAATKVEATPHGVMWKILQQKAERHQMNDQKQSEMHHKMHEFKLQKHGSSGPTPARFAGPRRKAA